MRILRFVPQGFRSRLLLIFLGISTLPLLATGIAFFGILNANVEAQTFGKLAFVRDAKASEIAQYLSFAERQAASLAKSNAVRYAIGDFYGFSYAFRQIDALPDRATALLQQIFAINDPGADHLLPVDDDRLLSGALEYANAHTQFHEDFADFVRGSEFDNIYLVNPEGRIVYSVTKDRYLGSDLTLGFRGTAMADLLERSRSPESPAITVSDFAHDAITGTFAAYVAVRVDFYKKFRGTLVLRLPVTGLDRLTQAQNGETGRLYLLGSGGVVVSAPSDSPAAIGAPAAKLPDAGSHAAIVTAGLGGVSALSAWAPVDFGDAAWTLVAEVPTATAFGNADDLKRVFALVALISLPILVYVIVQLSKAMAVPVVRLTEEVDHRVRAEDALRLSQQRLARLLDALNAGLVCVADSGVVTYANEAASTLAGRKIEAGVTLFSELIPQATAATVTGLVRADGRAAMEGIAISGRAPVRLSAFELEADVGGGMACVIIPPTGGTFAETEGLVKGVRAAIDVVGAALTSQSARPAQGDESAIYRQTLVDVTSLSLGLWRRVTGKGKIDFAEASGIWRASFDRSSLQVRTLDKYLLIETLPANPRWRDVVQTAEWVLGDVEHAAANDATIAHMHSDLSSRLSALRSHLKLHRKAPQSA
jgi:PAS domain-containing protein